MKKFLLVLVIAGVVVVQGYKILDRKAEERNSRERVALMFERLKSGNLADEQDAIGYWRVGHPETASAESANAFATFRSQRNLGRVDTYSILSSHLVEGSDASQRHVDIVCGVNGRTLTLRATHRFPLQWVD